MGASGPARGAGGHSHTHMRMQPNQPGTHQMHVCAELPTHVFRHHPGQGQARDDVHDGTTHVSVNTSCHASLRLDVQCGLATGA
mmetsp:Transcript_67615/g.179900  ORF Transcript_67615/g.179900 Transcript_67615/m.179900 type:complete len:84 (-) Transcript_67615:1214-1465(-)|eukprot:153219-Prymnesium_polylepis.2